MLCNINMLLHMIHFYRFSALVSAILIGFLLIWFGLRTYGLSRDIMDHQTPLAEKLSKIKNIQWTEYSTKNSESLYSYTDIFYKDDNWFAGSEKQFQPLNTLLASKPNSYFILNVLLTDNKHTARLKSLIDKEKYWQRIIFAAPLESTLKTLREISPRWTFASSPMFIVRFAALATLHLESLMDIKGDVLYISTASNSYIMNINLLINEAVRQKKYTLIGPVPKPWDEVGPIGWIIDITE